MSAKWKDSDRSKDLPPNWKTIRLKVLKRDDYICQWKDVEEGRCREVPTEVDHIKSSLNHDLTNLQSLCHRHHAMKTSKEASLARETNRKKVSSSFRRRTLQHWNEV